MAGAFAQEKEPWQKYIASYLTPVWWHMVLTVPCPGKIISEEWGLHSHQDCFQLKQETSLVSISTLNETANKLRVWGRKRVNERKGTEVKRTSWEKIRTYECIFRLFLVLSRNPQKTTIKLSANCHCVDRFKFLVCFQHCFFILLIHYIQYKSRNLKSNFYTYRALLEAVK